MTYQKKIITVFVSEDGITFNLASAYNAYNLNPAFIVGKLPTPIQSAGEALEQANALAESINIIKNKNWTAVVLQFDKWKSVPQSLLANELSKYEV
jgi:hypothetical protein